MSLSTPYIESLVKTIHFQSQAFMTLEEAQEFLSNNQDKVLEFTSISKSQCSKVNDFYQQEVKTRPIRRCDVEPMEHDHSTLLQKIQVSRDWNDGEQQELLLLWKLYMRDRDALLYELLHQWNTTRHQFVKMNCLVPFLRGSLGILDEKFHYRLIQVDRLFALTLTVMIMGTLQEPLPKNWENTITRALNGYKTKDVVIDEDIVSRILESLEMDLSKVEKKKVMLETGMDLGQVNEYLQTRLHLFSEFAFISPSLPAVALNAGDGIDTLGDTLDDTWPADGIDVHMESASTTKEQETPETSDWKLPFDWIEY